MPRPIKLLVAEKPCDQCLFSTAKIVPDALRAEYAKPEQGMYNQITEIKVLFKGGRSINRPVNPREIVTIAPED